MTLRQIPAAQPDPIDPMRWRTDARKRRAAAQEAARAALQGLAATNENLHRRGDKYPDDLGAVRAAVAEARRQLGVVGSELLEILDALDQVAP